MNRDILVHTIHTICTSNYTFLEYLEVFNCFKETYSIPFEFDSKVESFYFKTIEYNYSYTVPDSISITVKFKSEQTATYITALIRSLDEFFKADKKRKDNLNYTISW